MAGAIRLIDGLHRRAGTDGGDITACRQPAQPGCAHFRQQRAGGLQAFHQLRHLFTAEIIGRPIDSQGQLVHTNIQQRVTSLPLPCPPPRPVIAFAGGESKAAAILAVLRGQWLSGLVTDEACARQILDRFA